MTPRIPRGWVRWKVGTKATGQPWFRCRTNALCFWIRSSWAGKGSELTWGIDHMIGPYILPAPGSRKRNPNRKDGSK